MHWFEFLKFFHVAIAILWVGGGTGLFISGARAMQANDQQEIIHIAGHAKFMAERIFMPGSILMLLLGLSMVYVNTEGFTYTTAWVDLGILGVLASATIGMLILTPLVNKIAATESVEEAQEPARQLLRKGWADMVLLWTIIWNMVMKPQWSDWPEILAMLAVIAVAWLYFLTRKEAVPATA